MSDPAKSPNEIEDVLDSIRRLVTDNGSGVARAEAASQAPESFESGADPEVGRLVLSPSFRVEDSEGTSGETDDVFETVEDLVEELADADLSVDETRDADSIPEAEMTVVDHARTGGEWQPDDKLADFDTVGPDAVTDAEIAQADDETPALAEDIADPEEIADLARLDGVAASSPDLDALDGEFESETGDENWPSDAAEAALLSLVATRDGAVDSVDDADDGSVTPMFSRRSASVPDVVSDPEPMRDVDAIVEGPTDEDLIAALTEANAIDGEPSHDDTLGDGDADVEAAEADSLGALDAAVDIDLNQADAMVSEATAVDMKHDDVPASQDAGSGNETETPASNPEPDADEVAAAAALAAVDQAAAQASAMAAADGSDVASYDDAEYDVAEEDAEMGEGAGEPSLFAVSETDESLLDEETLREIIVDVVREELQGVMGQRITRNVRKMVRREIRLALAAETLE